MCRGGGCANGVIFNSIHIWPSSYAGEPASFCNLLKENRGYPFFLPETGAYWAGPMTAAAIGGSHAFTDVFMHEAEVGMISAAGMQDTCTGLMGDGLGVLLWFRHESWGMLARGVNCAYVAVCARLSGRATSISFSDVMAPGNAPETYAGLEVGEGSSAYVSKWMAPHANATRVLGPGVVVSADLGGRVVRSLSLSGGGGDRPARAGAPGNPGHRSRHILHRGALAVPEADELPGRQRLRPGATADPALLREL